MCVLSRCCCAHVIPTQLQALFQSLCRYLYLALYVFPRFWLLSKSILVILVIAPFLNCFFSPCIWRIGCCDCRLLLYLLCFFIICLLILVIVIQSITSTTAECIERK
jgi:hypothetical protein